MPLPVWMTLLLVLKWLDRTQAHPQCLNFNPPFNAVLTFCSRYSGVGCCTAEEDARLKASYESHKNKIARNTWNRCSADIKELQNVRKSEPGCLCLKELDSYLTPGLAAVHAGDGSNRLFLVEQIGLIHVLNLTNAKRLPEHFLDLKSNVAYSRNPGDEGGLLCLAFHPKYSENGRFFVFYVTLRDGVPRDVNWNADHKDKVRVSEFHVSRDNPNAADPTSERILLEIDKPHYNHNGGQILFGDDGYLYVFVGDGGRQGDPHNFAQNKSVLLGKVLRLDVDRKGEGGRSYAIPPDNPFLHESSTLPEIFAFGFRSPWRCGKDSGDRTTGEGKGRIICGDVGQNSFEELDLIKKGGNYGWRAREGNTCYVQKECDNVGPEVRPIHVYPHTVGKSVIGGNFYRGCRSPSLYGYYVYGDYASKSLFKLRARGEGQWENTEVFMCSSCPQGMTGRFKRYICAFGQDEHGEVYLLASNKGISGTLYQLVDPARSVLLGKVLRLDVDRKGEGAAPTPYPPTTPSCTSPAPFQRSSPLASVTPGVVARTAAIEQRRPATVAGEGKGRIICGDVGQNSFEELDLIKKGGNYGWRAREGNTCHVKKECDHVGFEERPIHVYPHTVGKSVIGGHFYRGCRSPSLYGYYVYGDYASKRLFKLRATGEGQWENTEVFMCGSCPRGMTGRFKRFICAFGQDEHGEVYLLASNKGIYGELYQLVDPARLAC